MSASRSYSTCSFMDCCTCTSSNVQPYTHTSLLGCDNVAQKNQRLSSRSSSTHVMSACDITSYNQMSLWASLAQLYTLLCIFLQHIVAFVVSSKCVCPGCCRLWWHHAMILFCRTLGVTRCFISYTSVLYCPLTVHSNGHFFNVKMIIWWGSWQFAELGQLVSSVVGT